MIINILFLIGLFITVPFLTNLIIQLVTFKKSGKLKLSMAHLLGLSLGFTLMATRLIF